MVDARKSNRLQERLQELSERGAERIAEQALGGIGPCFDAEPELWELARSWVFGDLGPPPEFLDRRSAELEAERNLAQDRFAGLRQKDEERVPDPLPPSWSWRTCVTIALLFVLAGLLLDRFLPEPGRGWSRWTALLVAAGALGFNAVLLATAARRCSRLVRRMPERLAARWRLTASSFRMARQKRRAARWLERRKRAEEWVRTQERALAVEFAHWAQLAPMVRPKRPSGDGEVAV